ncbi:MAG: K(+)-transporting ATPase subunit F [Caldilineaceae bacterium]
MNLELWAAAVVTMLLLIYLIYTLLFPERF